MRREIEDLSRKGLNHLEFHPSVYNKLQTHKGINKIWNIQIITLKAARFIHACLRVVEIGFINRIFSY